MNETKERLKTAFNYLKFKGLVKSQKKLAKDIGTSEPCVSYAMNGNEKYLTKNFLIKLNNAYNNIFNTLLYIFARILINQKKIY